MEREYGIGRVPADVDPVEEALAQVEAARITAATSQRLSGRTFICDGCGGEFPIELAMNASLGTSCPDCYDDLAG